MVSLFASLHKQHCSGLATLTVLIKNRLKCTALENLDFLWNATQILRWTSAEMSHKKCEQSQHTFRSGEYTLDHDEALTKCLMGGYRQPTSLRKQLTFCDAVAGFPMKWRPRNECRKFHTDVTSLSRSGYCFKFQPLNHFLIGCKLEATSKMTCHQ